MMNYYIMVNLTAQCLLLQFLINFLIMKVLNVSRILHGAVNVNN